MSEVPRVLLADQDPLARNLLRVVCDRSRIPVIAEAATVDDLLELCLFERPDVVVTASEIGTRIDDVLPAVVASGARVVVVCDDRSPERLTTILDSGVSGVLSRESTPEAVVEAVLAVASGEAALHPGAAVTLLHQWRVLRREGNSVGLSPRAALTPREQDVLMAMADGLSTKAIARRLGVAIKTVENHKTRVFDKLGVCNQAHAVSLAIGQGMVAASVSGADA
jgi:DNA-binding NarL/FixJ family response regulator